LGRYYALILLFIGSMTGLVLTSSLLLLFFFWEMVAICSYSLISYYHDDPKAVEGGIKALIITQLGGVGLLLGALIAYSYLGTYEIAVFMAHAAKVPPAALSVMAFGFLVGAAAKSAQVPFHTWLPGAMEAPTPISALIHAATMVNAGVYLLARFYPAFAEVPGWTSAVMIVGLLSALLGALMAIVAGDLKRALAYSTISQLGYMVYAVGVGGIFASQFHLLSHAVFKALLFLAAGAVIHAVGTRAMAEMGGLGRHMPFVRLAFVTGALALAGLPVVNGFWSKELVLEAGLAGGPLWAYLLMVLGAGLTAAYTWRMVSLVFYGPERQQRHVHDAGPAIRVALLPLMLGTLVTWLLVGGLGDMLEGTLPFHHLHTLNVTGLMVEVVTAPATLLALAVIVLGLLAWYRRDRLAPYAGLVSGITRAAQADFGFEWIYRGVVGVVMTAAAGLRATQTGRLNWNAMGIVGGLVVILGLLIWGS
jgi:NADH-quinone oxidoreductase subunit L